MKENRLTEGNILKSLLRFAIPVFAALFLQAMYGAVDLLVVGKYAEIADQSGVATGSMFTTSFGNVITCFAIGVTVLIGEAIGSGRKERAQTYDVVAVFREYGKRIAQQAVNTFANDKK